MCKCGRPRLAPAYRGPALVMGVGGSFAFVGTLPVAVTLGIGVKTSATVIGVGFMGFGVLISLPGFCWCLAVKRRRSSFFGGRRHQAGDTLPTTTATNKTPATSKDDGTLDSLMTPVHDSKAGMTSYGGTANTQSPLHKSDKEDGPKR